MPTDFSIAVRPGTGSDTPRADRERGARRQSMRGFEDTYVDIVDYIVRITHRIWEDQDVGYIYDTYAPGCFVYDDSGPNYGVEQVVDGTVRPHPRLPGHPVLGRRGHLGRRRRAGFRHLAPLHHHRAPPRRLALGTGRPAARSTSGASRTA